MYHENDLVWTENRSHSLSPSPSASPSLSLSHSVTISSAEFAEKSPQKPPSELPPGWPAFLLTGLWPVFCPIAVECSCLVYLTLLKAYFERFLDGAAATTSQQSSPLMSGSPAAAGEATGINGIKATGGARRSPKMGKYGAAGYAPAGSPEVAPKV